MVMLYMEMYVLLDLKFNRIIDGGSYKYNGIFLHMAIDE